MELTEIDKLLNIVNRISRQIATLSCVLSVLIFQKLSISSEDMVKKELPGSGAVTAAQADTLVQETCRAEVVHTVSCLLGLAFLRLWPGAGGAAVLAVWVLLANLPFMVIQRYNRPRLVRLAALLRKREQKKGDTSARTDTDL